MKKITKEGKIQEEFKDVPTEMTPLPPGFEWANLDIENKEELDQLTDFINEFYVESKDNDDFRLCFDASYLYWVMTKPGNKMEWQLKVINSKNKKIMAFIMCAEIELSLFDQKHKAAEVNFLLTHKKLREKKLG